MTDFKVRYSLSCMCMHRPTHTSLPLYHTLHLLCSHYKWFKPGCKLQHSHRLCNKQFNTCRLMSESVKIYVCLLWHAILCTDVNQSINQTMRSQIKDRQLLDYQLPQSDGWMEECVCGCVYMCVCVHFSQINLANTRRRSLINMNHCSGGRLARVWSVFITATWDFLSLLSPLQPFRQNMLNTKTIMRRWIK